MCVWDTQEAGALGLRKEKVSLRYKGTGKRRSQEPKCIFEILGVGKTRNYSKGPSNKMEILIRREDA